MPYLVLAPIEVILHDGGVLGSLPLAQVPALAREGSDEEPLLRTVRLHFHQLE